MDNFLVKFSTGTVPFKKFFINTALKIRIYDLFLNS